jgi:UDP-galactopyranose mutase
MKRGSDYLSEFTEWIPYEQVAVSDIYGTHIPVPFNLNSLHRVFDEDKASRIRTKLVAQFGDGREVPILDLCTTEDSEIHELAEYVDENIVLKYTLKQWGKGPDELDPSVTARVPVSISRDDRCYRDRFQAMPKFGSTQIFENLLVYENIKVVLGCDARSWITIASGWVMFDGHPFDGTVIFTGAIDEFSDLIFGVLPSRTIDFVLESHNVDFYQPFSHINSTLDQKYTRVTEFKRITCQVLPGKTTIARECTRVYQPRHDNPYYSVANSESVAVHSQYLELAITITKRTTQMLESADEFKKSRFLIFSITFLSATSICLTPKTIHFAVRWNPTKYPENKTHKMDFGTD